MNRVLEKLLVRRAIGICESGDITFITEVGNSVLGGSSVVHKEYNNNGTHGAEAIARALKEHLEGRADRDLIEIGVAVPGMRCYCMSREAPVETKEQVVGDNSDLSSVLRTAMAQQPDQYVVERSSATFNNRQYNTTVACGRTQLEEISSAISVTNRLRTCREYGIRSRRSFSSTNSSTRRRNRFPSPCSSNL